jgi:site-specific DNA-adenine methylase
MYPGGKNASYHHYINLMPPHSMYIELFLGSGAVMRRKAQAPFLNAAVEIDGDTLDYFGLLERDPRAATQIEVYKQDVLDFLSEALSPPTVAHVIRVPDALIFCDPPYLYSARSSARPIYKHEFGTEEEHLRLLALLKRVNCMVMLCGYPSQLYDEELADWNCYSYEAVTRGGTMMTECIWMNYPAPEKLHDHRFIGADYREREVHAKRVKTILRRWQRWTPLERAAYFAALQESGLV